MTEELLGRLRAMVGATPYPPANGAALLAAERSLGLPLPAPLRALHATVGNGGFGPPGGTLIGVVGGQTLEGYAPRPVTLAGLYSQAVRDGDAVVFNGQIVWEWPAALLPFCDWGCGIFSCAWCRHPDWPIYVWDWNMPETMALVRHTDSLTEWLTRWADGVDLWPEMRRLAPDWSEPEPSEW